MFIYIKHYFWTKKQGEEYVLEYTFVGRLGFLPLAHSFTIARQFWWTILSLQYYYINTSFVFVLQFKDWWQCQQLPRIFFKKQFPLLICSLWSGLPPIYYRLCFHLWFVESGILTNPTKGGMASVRPASVSRVGKLFQPVGHIATCLTF